MVRFLSREWGENFNPQGSREPRRRTSGKLQCNRIDFNPQGSREPRPDVLRIIKGTDIISIHKALASLDFVSPRTSDIEKEFQSTRLSRASTCTCNVGINGPADFNPQGSREPRLSFGGGAIAGGVFQSTRLSRASTQLYSVMQRLARFQSTRLSRASTIYQFI